MVSRRAVFGGLILGVVVIAGAAAGWWLRRPAAPAPLSRDWHAVVSVIAGDGVPLPRDGQAFAAGFADPFGLALGPDGAIYVADGVGSHRIRRVSPDGVVTTVAGGERGFADGPGAYARFDTPSGIAIDASGVLYVADTGNNAVRRIGPDGLVTTVATGFNAPLGVAVDAAGRVIVADTYNDRIAVVENGGVRTIAADGGFYTPSSVAVDATGRIFVADTGNGSVRVIEPSESTWVHPGGAALYRPVGIAVTPSGDAYVSEERGWITELRSDGGSRVVAGSTRGFRDGAGREARFRQPAGIAFAEEGRLIVADAGNAVVRLVAAPERRGFQAPPSPAIAPRFDVDAFRLQPLLWPVEPIEGPHEIAGTSGEARGEGGERMHLGIDIRAEQNTLVHALRDGVVRTPLALDAFGTLSESIRIGGISYVHVRAGREQGDALLDEVRFVPTYEGERLIDLRVKRGARFRSSEIVGTVNAFNHVHLNVGWPGEEYNPLVFELVNFQDTIAPTIARGGIMLYDPDGQRLTARERGRLIVSGPVQIVVDAWDQADGNRPNRRLGLYDLGYQVLNRDGTPAPGFEAVRHTMRFDRLASDPESVRLVYASGSGIPFYGNRRTRFLYTVTNTLRDGLASRGFWDPSQLAPGDYTLRIWAADIRGNVAVINRDLAVSVRESSDRVIE
jgi:sugar lactone lactonase YvrE